MNSKCTVWRLFLSSVSLRNAVTFLGLITIVTMTSCSSTGQTTPTGIPLPPDAKISAPEFKAATEDEGWDDEEEPAAPEPQKAPEPPVQKLEKTKKPVKKVAKAAKAKPKQDRSANSTMNPLFSVVPSDKVPFELGERQELALSWTALPAGRAVIEVRKGEEFDGRKTFWLWGNVLSSKIVDAIYHVDNTVESFIDMDGFIPYKFLLHMVESVQKKETRVSFDHTKKKAFYWAQRISQRWGDEKIDRADDLVPQAKDMFSGIFFARTLNYKLNQKQRFYIYENGKNWQVELIPVANELITSKVGAFQCWKIAVNVTLDNVLKPTGDVFMWLSDDSKKYLVKFEAKIKIGSLYGNLTSLREKL